MIVVILHICVLASCCICSLSRVVSHVSSIGLLYPARFLQRPLLALDGVSCSFSNNDIISIVGPSGSGKSSLAKVISKVVMPTSGEVHFRTQPAGIAYITDQFASSYNSQICIRDLLPATCLDNEFWVSAFDSLLGIKESDKLDQLQVSQR